MLKALSRLACGAALIAALAPVTANAVIIDFEGDLVGLYFPGDSFEQNGFRMTQDEDFGDFGTVDSALGLGPAAPTNNATQYYSNLNDGGLIFTSLNGLPFSLSGFSAAFVPLIGSTAPAQVVTIVAFATAMNGSQFGTAFSLGDTSSTTTGSPFFSFSGAAFSGFTNLKSLEFFACAFANGQVCAVPTQNNGQFALDNVNLAIAAPIPEPETTALMALGLVALTAVARRRRAR